MYKIGSHTFSSYAFNAVKNELKYVARTNAKAGKELSINTPTDGSGEYDAEYVDCLESPENLEEDVMKNESREELRQALGRLSEEEKELIDMVYYKNMSLKAYADEKKISHQSAMRRKKMVLKKLGIYLA